MEEQPYPPKVNEVFRWFGAAAHNAQLFEADLLSLRLVAAAVDGQAVTEGELRSLEAALSRKTLGQLMVVLKTRGDFSQTLEDDWARALDRRNYLIHRFFWANAVRLYQADGCDALVCELQELATLFASCQESARQVVAQLITSLGVDRAEWDAVMQRELDLLFEEES